MVNFFFLYGYILKIGYNKYENYNLFSLYLWLFMLYYIILELELN